MMQFGVARACVTAHVGADPAGALGKPKRLAKARQSAAGLASLASMSRTRGSLPKSRTSAVARCLKVRSAALRVFVQRSEEHTSELQSLMRNSYAVFCLNKISKNNVTNQY